MKRVHVIGVGPGGLDQVTVEAVRALREVDYFVVVDKSAHGDGPDPLADARDRLLARHLADEPVVVRLTDPARERRPDHTGTQADYDDAVMRWHRARAAAYESALAGHDGVAGFLVWGDPAFYDSTLRILDRIAARGVLALDVEVIPGVSSVQLLAARHRIVLHDVGAPLHVTTGRRLGEAVAGGQRNVVAMLNRDVDLPGLDDWSIWWGANLGTEHEALVAGRVGDVRAEIAAVRAATGVSAGWVMDLFLLRAPDSQPDER